MADNAHYIITVLLVEQITRMRGYKPMMERIGISNGRGPKCKTQDWVDKVVTDTFNELLVITSSKTNLHPSEQVYRKDNEEDYSLIKIYDFINNYHGYCRLCDQHFYSKSVGKDINSFFQKHLNTAYHRQIQAGSPLSEKIPMFTWEENLLSGRCNACEMSNINSYVIDTNFDIKHLLKVHYCFWDEENRESNERVLRKLNLLKKYCSLKIFQEKYIKTINGIGVCFLCKMKLPWSGEKAKCHLSSYNHYQNFCEFLRVKFDILPRDALNGFNLEAITRWLITHNPQDVLRLINTDEVKLCVQQSNNNKNPYTIEWGNFSFSPKLPLLAGNIGFMSKNKFSFSDKAVCMSSKFDQPSDEAPTIVIESEDPQKYFILRIIAKYNELKTELNVTPVPKPPEKDYPNTFSQDKYFRNLFKKKIDLINRISAKPTCFCHICDQRHSVAEEVLHLESRRHLNQEKKLKELKKHFANEKFTEPFHKIRNVCVCLLCAVTFDPNSFFSHLKGVMHSKQFDWYCSQKKAPPISSSFTFKKDFSCVCNHCETSMAVSNSYHSIKMTLVNIRFHWPCKKKEKIKTEFSNELKDIVGEKNSRLTNKKSKVNNITRRWEKNSLDLTKVEQTLEKIVDVFEKQIMYNIVDKSAAVLSDVNHCNRFYENTNTKISERKLPPIAFEDPNQTSLEKVLTEKHTNSSASEDSLKEERSCSTSEETMEPRVCTKKVNNLEQRINCVSIEKGQNQVNHIPKVSILVRPIDHSAKISPSEKRMEEKCVKILKNESRVHRTDNNINEKKVKADENKKKENVLEENEILMIEGLPKSKRNRELIYSKFNPFGRIQRVYYSKKVVYVEFVNCSAAEMAAKAPSLFQENKLTFKIVSREEPWPLTDKNAERLPTLKEDLVILLQDPMNLMNFSQSLNKQAIAMLESSIERRREDFVCSTIIGAVSHVFPKGRCYAFGSRLSGLTLKNSDLDVFLDCGDMYDGFKNTTPFSERKLVNKVALLLKKKREIMHINVVDRARVPIVSFLHKPTLMRCDLSFKNGLSVQNTLLIKYMISLDWRVRPLILLLKHWMKLNGLHGPPFFSSYAVAMLVIYYLEQLECPVLPTIESLQNNYVGKRKTIAGWDCSINFNETTLPKSCNKDPLPKILADLFDFYSKFDYKANVISPLTGKPLPRNTFSISGRESLPMSYKKHILNLPPPIENLVSKDFCICIMDPFDLSHILTKSFPPRGLFIFIQLCSMSAEIMKKAITAEN